MKNVRPDLLIAICALIVSALATGASWWQSRVVAQQLSAQVWPYLSLRSALDNAGLTISVTNDGLGPAIVRTVVVAVDGTAYRDVAGAVRALAGGRPPAGGPHDVFAAASLLPGEVIRVGGSVQLLSLRNRAYARALAASDLQHRLDVRLCYCAIVGECFRRSTGEADPHRVASCPRQRDELAAPTGASMRRLFAAD